MFPWVDDPVRSPKETLRALAAEAAGDGDGDGEEPSLGEEPSMGGRNLRWRRTRKRTGRRTRTRGCTRRMTFNSDARLFERTLERRQKL